MTTLAIPPAISVELQEILRILIPTLAILPVTPAEQQEASRILMSATVTLPATFAEQQEQLTVPVIIWFIHILMIESTLRNVAFAAKHSRHCIIPDRLHNTLISIQRSSGSTA